MVGGGGSFAQRHRRDEDNGIGPEMAFVNRILKECGLGMPCTIGDTNINEWERGRELYAHMVRRVKALVRDRVSISVLLWYQGESDTITLTGESRKHISENFPRSREVHWFLNKFVDDCGIRDLIRFNREVIRGRASGLGGMPSGPLNRRVMAVETTCDSSF